MPGLEDGVDGVMDPILEWFRQIEEWCPGILGKVLHFLVDIPQASERGLFDLADAYGEAGKVLSEHLTNVAHLSAPISETWSGDGAAFQFQQNWGMYLEQTSNSVGSLYRMQELAQNAGIEVEMMKFMAAMNLYMLATAIYAILSTAVITLGLSTVAAPAAEVACQTGIRAALRRLLTRLMEKKFSGAIGDFGKLLAEKAAPKALEKAAPKVLEDAGAAGARKAATEAAESAANAGFWAGAKSAGTKFVSNVGSKVFGNKFVSPFLKWAGDRVVARGAADRAAATFAKDALANGLRQNIAKKAVTQMVRGEAYRAELAKLSGQSLGQVWKQAGADIARASWGRAKGFAMFNLKTTVGFTALQWAEGHNPKLDVVDLTTSTLKFAAIGALGGPLSVAFGHGMVGEASAFMGGTAAVNGVLAGGFGVDVDWHKELVGAGLFGAMGGAQHGPGALGGHVLEKMGETRFGEAARADIAAPRVDQRGVPLTAAPATHGLSEGAAGTRGGSPLRTESGTNTLRSSGRTEGGTGSGRDSSGSTTTTSRDTTGGHDGPPPDPTPSRDTSPEATKSDTAPEATRDGAAPEATRDGTAPAAGRDNAAPETAGRETAGRETGDAGTPLRAAPAHEAAPAELGGRDGAAHDGAAGRDSSGGRDATGRDATGRDATGRDATGRDATGRDATGRDATRDGNDGRPPNDGPRDGTPHEGTPRDSATRDGTPHDGTPRDTATHDGGPRDGTPHDGTTSEGGPRRDDATTAGGRDRVDPAQPVEVGVRSVDRLAEVGAGDVHLPERTPADAARPEHAAAAVEVAPERAGPPADPIEARRLADHQVRLDAQHAPAHEAGPRVDPVVAPHIELGRPEAGRPEHANAEHGRPEADRAAERPEREVEAELTPSERLTRPTRTGNELTADVRNLVERAKSELLSRYPESAIQARIRDLDAVARVADRLDAMVERARTSGDVRELVDGVRELSRSVNEYSDRYRDWRADGHDGRPADAGWRDLNGVDPLNSVELAIRGATVDPATHRIHVMDQAIMVAKVHDVMGPEIAAHVADTLARTVPKDLESAEHLLDRPTFERLKSEINTPSKGMVDPTSGHVFLGVSADGSPRPLSAVAATAVHESMHRLQPNMRLVRDAFVDRVSETELRSIRIRLRMEREAEAFTVQQQFLRGLAGHHAEAADHSGDPRVPRQDGYQELANKTPEQIREYVATKYFSATERALVAHEPGVTGPAEAGMSRDAVVDRARQAAAEAHHPLEPRAGTLRGPATIRLAERHGVDLEHVSDLQTHESRTGGPGHDAPAREHDPLDMAEERTPEHTTVGSGTIEGTGYVPDGRPAYHPDVTPRELHNAVDRVDAHDFAGGRIVEVYSYGDVVHVSTVDGRTHVFRPEVGEGMRDVATTELHRGTENDPHIMRVNNRVAAEQLARTWVHEITHTLHEQAAAAHRAQPEGVLRRSLSKLGELLGFRAEAPEPVPEGDPHTNARVNERRLLMRELRGEPSLEQRARLRDEIAGVDRDLARLGHPTERLEPVPPERGARDDAYPSHERATEHERAADHQQHPDGERGTAREESAHDEIWTDPRWQLEGRRPSMDELIPSTQREIDAWGERIKSEFEELFHDREFGGLRTRLDLTDKWAVELNPNSVTIRLSLVHPEHGVAHNAVAYTFHRYYDGSLYADHGLVRLPKEMQGQGFAKAFNRYAENWYRYSGLDHIEIHASMSTGGFAWARAGFDWAPDTMHRVEPILRKLADELRSLRTELDAVERYQAGDHTVDLGPLRERYGTDDPAALADHLRREHEAGRDILDRARPEAFGTARFPRPEEIASAGWDGQQGKDSTWLGKRTMLESNWKGVKPISDGGPVHPRSEIVGRDSAPTESGWHERPEHEHAPEPDAADQRPEDQLEPIDPEPPASEPAPWPVDPVNGYEIAPRDLEFIGVSHDQVEAWMAREAPLGMTRAEYREWRVSLLEALRADGIPPREVDIRLRGSSADFFSGVHKKVPTAEELAGHPEAQQRLQEWLGDDPHRPVSRPFDSMHKLGVDEPSDYDINISSGRMFEEAASRWSPGEFNGPLSKDHGYLNKALVSRTFPHVDQWAREWTERTGRDMSYAVFDRGGPADSTHLGFNVHFRDSDWIVNRPDEAPQHHEPDSLIEHEIAPDTPEVAGPHLDSWGIPEFPRTLPDGHPLLRPTDTINTPERIEFRRQVVESALEGVRPNESGRPTVHVMGGGGASGKGWVLHMLTERGEIPHDNVVHLDPDGLKESIPEYKQIVDAGDSRAAAVVHEESSALAKSILSEAIDRRLDLVYDVTLGDPRKAVDLLQRLRDAGYDVNLYGVSADAQTAVERNSSRAAETGRYVPIEMQLKAHQGFSRGFEAYAELATQVRLFDTNGEAPLLVAAKEPGGELHVFEHDAYDAFQHKADLDPNAAGPGELYPERPHDPDNLIEHEIAPEPDSWGIPEFPRTLADGDPLLRPTNTIDTPERIEFRREVVEHALEGVRPNESGRPTVHVMGGGGASGKGWVLHMLTERGEIPHDNVVHLDPDGLKESIPEYKQIVDAGDSRAAAVVHEESSVLAKSILSEAIDRRLDLVYDVTLGDPGKALGLLQRLRDAGYDVNLYGVSADAQTAVERNSSRAAETGRYVPIEMQLHAHQGFSRGFEAYAELATRVQLYDTNGAKPELIAAKPAGGELRVFEHDAYEAFQHKADLDPKAAGPSELYRPAERVEPGPGPGNREGYVDKGMANLAATSRTASGTIDTTASAGKADQMAADLSGARAAELAQGNYRDVLEHLYDNRSTEFATPAELRSFVEDVVRRVNSGITREGVLYREHDSTKYPSYTAVRDLEPAARDFFSELHRRINDPHADPIETAAFVEYRMDLTDHLWADGCGKSAKAISAWTLMRGGHELPTYPAERAAQFEHAPKLPRAAGEHVDAVQFHEWLDHYRTQFPRYEEAPDRGWDEVEREHAGDPRDDSGRREHDTDPIGGPVDPARPIVGAADATGHNRVSGVQILRDVHTAYEPYHDAMVASGKRVTIIRFEPGEGDPPEQQMRMEASRISAEQKVKNLTRLGLGVDHIVLRSDVLPEDFAAAIERANADPHQTAIIVQMPPPARLRSIVDFIDAAKDIDGLLGDRSLMAAPATSDGIVRVAEPFLADNPKVAVVGANGFIGRGVVELLGRHGIDPIKLDAGDDLMRVHEADVVITVTGAGDVLGPEHLSPHHRVVIDSSFVPQVDGTVRGDIQADATGIPQHITPVPGGIGPVEMAILMERAVRSVADPNLAPWRYVGLPYEGGAHDLATHTEPLTPHEDGPRHENRADDDWSAPEQEHGAAPAPHPNVNGTPFTPLTEFVDPATGRDAVVDQNGLPHVTATDGDNARSRAALPFLNGQLARGEAYDPATGEGTVFRFQDDHAGESYKGVVKDVDGGQTVSGTTSDLIKVTYASGKIVRVESYDVTGSDKNPFNLQQSAQTILNKMDLAKKAQTQFVVFVARDDAEAQLVADRFAGDHRVRVLNPATGFDSERRRP